MEEGLDATPRSPDFILWEGDPPPGFRHNTSSFCLSLFFVHLAGLVFFLLFFLVKRTFQNVLPALEISCNHREHIILSKNDN